MKILAIETSCDETSMAIVEDGIKILGSVLASSREFHEKTGGIVPEVAARKQVDFILPVLKNVLSESNLSLNDIDKIAITVGPGLIGSLLIGVTAAKSLAFSQGKKLIPVNHLVGHIYANWLETENLPKFPAVALVVSGGHTDLVYLKDHGDMEYLGGTLDDAAGEAFDKTARLLGIKKYLGGYDLSLLAQSLDKNEIKGLLPRPKIKDPDFDFSFSGLKTAVKKLYEEQNYSIAQIAKEFEEAVVDVLVEKTINAAKSKNVKTLLLGGGVSANTLLRDRLKDKADDFGIDLRIPKKEHCMDTATYIGSCAFFNQKELPISEIDANPSLGIMDTF